MGELNYGRMMQRAMQGLMVEALSEVAKNGLPGDHHFYISFLTQHPGVVVPEQLRAQFPEELMIVLQHEYSDLTVTPEQFSVRLSFDNKPSLIVVPFDAVCQFADPSAEFGLRFDQTESAEEPDGADDGQPADEVFAELSRRRSGSAAEGEDDAAAESEDEAQKDKAKGDVVSLDSFRKK